MWLPLQASFKDLRITWPHQTIWHALNQREIAKRYCRENGLKYNEQTLIVCHLGSGFAGALALEDDGMLWDGVSRVAED